MTRRPFGLTRRGWTVAGAAVGLLFGGRLLGADELSVVGLAALAILLGGIGWVWCTRPGVDVARRPRPTRLHVGDGARVDLVVRSRRPSTALVDLTEPIDDDRLRARFLLAPLTAGEVVEPAYRLPTDRRGPMQLGPAWITRSDPLGLVRRRHGIAPADTVLVRPRTYAIAAPTFGGGRSLAPDDDSVSMGPATDGGGEFLAVRPYEVGDDPRRVHWRSTARVDDLMVRQHVAPRRGRTLVVLDTRSTPDGPITTPPFERAVEATASIVAALQRARRPVECTTTGGTALARPGDDDAQRTLDRLATVMLDEADLLDALARTHLHHRPELVVLVTGGADDHVRRAARLLGSRGPVIVVVTGGEPPPTGAATAVVDARGTPFPDAWRVVTQRWRAGATRTPLRRRSPPWILAAASHPPSRSPR